MATASVIICAYTHDRWDDLVAAISQLTADERQPDETLLVIDHNESLLSKAQRYFADPRNGVVTVVPNTAKQGLSGARNTGVVLARGEIVVFLDDDACPSPGWLAELLRHYDDPRVVGVGGSARPVWPTEEDGRPGLRPAQLPSADVEARGEFDWVVGCTYQGQPVEPAMVRNLMGCNMSFRREVFGQVSGFNQNLGRVGRTPLGAEETELCIRIRQADPDSQIVFAPAAQVRHRVSADRVRWKYLVRRCYAEGLSKAAVSALVGSDAALESEKSYVVQVLGRAVLRELGRVVTGSGRGGRLAGAAGASAIVVGLGATAIGYGRGLASRRLLRAARSGAVAGGSALLADAGSRITTLGAAVSTVTSPDTIADVAVAGDERPLSAQANCSVALPLVDVA